MRSIFRRLVVAILSIAVASQLAQGQLLLCEQMEITEAVPAGGHERHDAAHDTGVIVDRGANTPAPTPSDCILAASCVNVSAVPVVSPPVPGAGLHASVVQCESRSTPALAVQPEPPPPRA